MSIPAPAIEAADLLLGDDHDFVVNIYLALLRRWPDDGGYRRYLGMIANRPEERAAALLEIAGSDEARRSGHGVVLTWSGNAPDVSQADPLRAARATLALRTTVLHGMIEQLRDAVGEVGGFGDSRALDLQADIVEARDAELRSEINGLRREMQAQLQEVAATLADRGIALATAPEAGGLARRVPELEQRVAGFEAELAGQRGAAAELVARLVCDYVGEMLAVAEARFEARLRGLEARLLAAPPRDAAP